MKKDIWYEIIRGSYDPYIPWEEKHVRVTLGEKKIGRIYSLFNREEESRQLVYIDFSKDDDPMTNFQIQESWNDIKIGKSVLMGFCGNLEVLKSENPDEFKIEFL